MIDPVSIIGLAVGVAAAGAQLARSLFQVANKLKTAPAEISRIAREFSMLSCIFQTIVSHLEKSQHLCTDELFSTIQEIVERYNYIQTEISKIVESGRKGPQRLRHVRLFFKNPKIKALLIRVESIKSSINLVLGVIQLAREQKEAENTVDSKSPSHINEFRKVAESLLEVNINVIQAALIEDDGGTEKRRKFDKKITRWVKEPDDTAIWLYHLIFSSDEVPSLARRCQKPIAPAVGQNDGDEDDEGNKDNEDNGNQEGNENHEDDEDYEDDEDDEDYENDEDDEDDEGSDHKSWAEETKVVLFNKSSENSSHQVQWTEPQIMVNKLLAVWIKPSFRQIEQSAKITISEASSEHSNELTEKEKEYSGIKEKKPNSRVTFHPEVEDYISEGTEGDYIERTSGRHKASPRLEIGSRTTDKVPHRVTTRLPTASSMSTGHKGVFESETSDSRKTKPIPRPSIPRATHEFLGSPLASSNHPRTAHQTPLPPYQMRHSLHAMPNYMPQPSYAPFPNVQNTHHMDPFNPQPNIAPAPVLIPKEQPTQVNPVADNQSCQEASVEPTSHHDTSEVVLEYIKNRQDASDKLIGLLTDHLLKQDNEEIETDDLGGSESKEGMEGAIPKVDYGEKIDHLCDIIRQQSDEQHEKERLRDEDRAREAVERARTEELELQKKRLTQEFEVKLVEALRTAKVNIEQEEARKFTAVRDLLDQEIKTSKAELEKVRKAKRRVKAETEARIAKEQEDLKRHYNSKLMDLKEQLKNADKDLMLTNHKLNKLESIASQYKNRSYLIDNPQRTLLDPLHLPWTGNYTNSPFQQNADTARTPPSQSQLQLREIGFPRIEHDPLGTVHVSDANVSQPRVVLIPTLNREVSERALEVRGSLEEAGFIPSFEPPQARWEGTRNQFCQSNTLGVPLRSTLFWEPACPSHSSELLHSLRMNGWRPFYKRFSEVGETYFLGDQAIHINFFDPNYKPQLGSFGMVGPFEPNHEWLIIGNDSIEEASLEEYGFPYRKLENGGYALEYSLTSHDIERLVERSFMSRETELRKHYRFASSQPTRYKELLDQQYASPSEGSVTSSSYSLPSPSPSPSSSAAELCGEWQDWLGEVYETGNYPQTKSSTASSQRSRMGVKTSPDQLHTPMSGRRAATPTSQEHPSVVSPVNTGSIRLRARSPRPDSSEKEHAD